MVEGTYALASTNGHTKRTSGLSHRLDQNRVKRASSDEFLSSFITDCARDVGEKRESFNE